MASEFDPSTKTLSFFGQALKLNNEVDAAPVADKIRAADPLEVLCMEGCTVGPEAAREIGKAMESKPDLKRMQFQDMFTGRLKQEIPLCLKYFGSGLELASARLVELNLSDNAIGPIGSEGLVPILRSEVCYTLKELRLNNTGLGPRGSTMVAEALMDCFEASSEAKQPLGLRVFIAGRSRLENTGATLFAKVFAKMKTLEEISVPQNGIFPEGIKALSEALKENPNMRSINFEDNIVKLDGIRGIGDALRTLENVQDLNLGDGLVKTKGAMALAEALRDTPSKLKTLILSSNEIRLEGALAVVDGLENHVSTLRSVNLDGNFFDESGAEEITARVSSIGAEGVLTEFEEFPEPESGEESEADEGPGGEPETEEEADEGGHDKVNGHAEPKVTAKEFFERPTLAAFKELGPDPVADLEAAMKELFPSMDPLERDVELIARICGVLNGSNASSPDAASVAPVVKTLMEILFRGDAPGGDAADVGRRTDLLVNHTLVCMGLLKHEDKKWRMQWDPEGLLISMKHLVKEPYFPNALRDYLQFFLARPSKMDQYPTAKHELLRHLF